jgi:hypothetical protein
MLVHADAVKYRQSNGQIVISNVGASGGAKVVSVYEAENASASQQQNAVSDLQRQRQFVETKERERYMANLQPSATQAPRSNNAAEQNSAVRDRIHACLMKVTATFGLSPSEEARRKVSCFINSKGMQDECEYSVAATMKLSSNDELNYKAQCRQIAGR